MSAHMFATAGQLHCPFMPVFGAPAVMFERGLGTELWDTDGKRYLDFLSGIAYHRCPIIRFLNPVQTSLPERQRLA